MATDKNEQSLIPGSMITELQDVFLPSLRRWCLAVDGEPITTHSSHLLPVRQNGVPAMLKVSFEKDEKLGALLMAWWGGEGAARVLAHDGDALLLERALGSRSLEAFARDGRDDEATLILCDAAKRLHAHERQPPSTLITLETWFQELWAIAEREGGDIARCAAIARSCLDQQREVTVLHGDLHHGNVLDFGPRGWLAIDPKHIKGDRAFDYANIFCNPDDATATCPTIFERRVRLVAKTADLERIRLLRWIAAWAGLSAAWFLGDNMSAELDMRIAALALQALENEPRTS